MKEPISVFRRPLAGLRGPMQDLQGPSKASEGPSVHEVGEKRSIFTFWEWAHSTRTPLHCSFHPRLESYGRTTASSQEGDEE